ncbi:MAG: HAMP domain-containing histidine kinase [Deltaproteobacteria bacterium]|nr:HAMP domain-containing histidine kinase [Deltaproteobacteria bacterium]
MAHDLDQAYDILKKKEEDYTAYRFKTKETMAIFAFFDLAQEFATITNLYRTAVAVIKFFFGYESCIYTIRPEDEALMLQCCTAEGLLDSPIQARADVVIQQSPYRVGSSFIFPIIGKKVLADKVPLFLDDQILGMLEIYPVKRMSNHESLFFQKYANRVGYNMHNKLVVEQNIEHIQFINQLVSDIEHNVITPNLYYKAFLINMKRYLKEHLAGLEHLSSLISNAEIQNHSSQENITQVVNNLKTIHEDMGKKMEDFEIHFKHLSLFIETLFRREHFKTGSYVLKRRSYNLLKDIFLPELEHFSKRLGDRNIDIVEPRDVPSDSDLTIFVDLGLTAQVFANLFSNALKYCQPAFDESGNPRKYVSYRIDMIGMESDDTQKALEVDLFTTGIPISPKEALLIFEDGYKIAGDNTEGGSGHGLHFVNNIVHLHGGHAGCRPKENGNVFYIVLPKVPRPNKTEQRDKS